MVTKNGSKILWLRFIVPSLITLNLFMLGGISFQLHRIEDKIFTHLTNHDIHVPREQIVSQAEFEMHCLFADKHRDEIMIKLEDIRNAQIEYLRGH